MIRSNKVTYNELMTQWGPWESKTKEEDALKINIRVTGIASAQSFKFSRKK